MWTQTYKVCKCGLKMWGRMTGRTWVYYCPMCDR